MAMMTGPNSPGVKLYEECVRNRGALSLSETKEPNGDIIWVFVFSEHARRPSNKVHNELVRIISALHQGSAVLLKYDITNRGYMKEWQFEILEFSSARMQIRNVYGNPINPLSGVGTLNLSPLVSEFDIGDMPEPQLLNGGTVIEPYVGYRDFDVLAKDDIYDPSLISRNGLLWNPYEPMVATCNGNIFSWHDAPEVECMCGIYAFDSPSHDDLKSTSNIWGEVYLWGTVLVCESGYRAQYAYPKTLFIRDVGTELIKRFAANVEKAYGVPVHLVGHRSNKTASELMEEAINKMLEERNDESA